MISICHALCCNSFGGKEEKTDIVRKRILMKMQGILKINTILLTVIDHFWKLQSLETSLKFAAQSFLFKSNVCASLKEMV